MLREGPFGKRGKLPAEDILARQLGVSRNVLRDVLASLEAEGFITRRRGIGTMINQYVLDAPSRLDLEKDFEEMIEEAGYRASLGLVTGGVIPAEEEVAKDLHLEVGEKVLKVEKLLLADDRPAIYVLDYIPYRLIEGNPYTPEELKIPIFRFLKRKSQVKVEIVLMDVEPRLPDGIIAGMIGVEPSEPIMYVHEIGYSCTQTPVLLSQAYYRNGVFRLSILRRNYLG
ncbi:MAG: GntR family transcriptional regulator [Thermoanaerobacteraceae bacterium]|nr:GntR family transcriptional regulator [Thermoanaerobacteraceae bacterium]